MRKWLPAVLCLMLLLAQRAVAEESAPGAYARTIEAQAKAAGMEVRTETTIGWGGLPLLDSKVNTAIKSALDAFRLDTFARGDGSNGYMGFEATLRGTPVLDLTMYAQDSLYYEQSNLLGGQTVGFTREDFATFVRRLSDSSGGVMPQEIGWLFELAMVAIGGTGNLQLESGTLDKAIASYDQWQLDALKTEDRVRPTVYIPGLFGTQAAVVDVTREETLSLADAIGALLAGDGALLSQAVRLQAPLSDETRLREILARVDEALLTFPKTLESALPENLAPSEFREIYGPDGALVVRQFDIALPDDVSILIEWVPEGAGMPAAYVSVAAESSRASLLLTRDIGTPRTLGKVIRARNSLIAEFMLEDGGFRADMMMTRTENYERQSKKETMTAKTDWIIESPALFGEGAVVTVTAKESGTASGTGDAYTRKHETAWTVKGLGFDSQTLLTVATQTRLREAAAPALPETEIILYPARLSEADFNAWIEGDVQISLIQAGLTVLGQLPKEAAAYVLERMR